MGRWGGNSGQAHCMDFLPNKLFTPKFVLFLGQVHMHRGTFHSAISENFGGFRKLEPSHYFFTWGLKPLERSSTEHVVGCWSAQLASKEYTPNKGRLASTSDDCLMLP